MRLTGPADLAFREASTDDAGWLLELRLATMTDHFERSGLKLSPEEQQARLMQAFSAVRIVQLGGRDVGMMKVVKEPDVWHLVQIQLLVECQNRGLGARLIRGLLHEAEGACVPVSLHVLKVNPAFRLYQRLGFEVVADSDDSYVMHWKPVAAPRA